MLEEAAYNGLVSGAFKKILAAADQLDPDLIDAESTGDMVTLTSRSGSKVVVNTQRAVHFSWDAGCQRWLDDKGKGLELLDWVKACVKTAAGVELPL
jgi:CyaY protein